MKCYSKWKKVCKGKVEGSLWAHLCGVLGLVPKLLSDLLLAISLPKNVIYKRKKGTKY